MDPLGKVHIGRTVLEVTRLGLGCSQLAGFLVEVPEDQALGTVRRAITLGIKLFDTAPFYGYGKSEMELGKALAGADPDSRVLATKVGRVLQAVDPARAPKEEFWRSPAPFRPVFDFSYDGIMRSFEESKKRLKVDRVDILYIHDPDNHYEQAIEAAYPALDQLRREGQIKAVGAGMNQAEMLARFARAGDFDCFLLAGRYTLIDQTGLAELLPLCVEKHISIIVGGPYNSGILATGARPGATFNYRVAPPEVVDKVRKVEEVCGRHGVPLKAAALQFPLAYPAVAAIIPGAKSAAEVEENFRLMSFPIPADFWAELRAKGLLPDEAPVPQ